MQNLEMNRQITKKRSERRVKKKKVKKLAVIVGFLVVAAFVFTNTFLTKIVNGDNVPKYDNLGEKGLENLSKHNYTWSCLVDEDGKKKYIDKNGVKALFGIDVSKHQGDIDWRRVKKENVDFAMIRVGYRGYSTGDIVQDNKFINNIEGANKVNIDTGVYFFSQAISVREAEEEAEFVLDSIKNYDVKFPIVFDMEFVMNARANKLSVEEKTKVAIAFCEKIKNAGYQPMIYGSRGWLRNEIFLPDVEKYNLWVSEYLDQPKFPYEFQMWQYTDKGRIDGISYDVDLNLCFIDYGR